MKKLFLSILIAALLCLQPISSLATTSTAVRTVYGTTNVLSTAWTQVVASLAQFSTAVSIYDSSGQPIKIGVGVLSSEVTQMIVPPSAGATVVYPLKIPAGARITIEATTGTASTGESDITFFH